MKTKKLLWIGLFCLMTTVMPALTAFGQEETAQTEETPELAIDKVGTGEKADAASFNSVLQVVLTYTTEDGEKVALQGGSGFLIGETGSQLQYLVTTQKVAVLSAEVEAQLRETYELEDKDTINTELEIVISSDVTVGASIVTASEEMDFAILRLEQGLYDRTPLLLNDKGMDEYLRNTVSAIGYPSAAQFGEELVYYTTDALQKTDGFLEMEQVINGQKYVQHHIFPNYGNIGGPIVDESGTVLALNQSTNDGKNFYALEIGQIMSVCDSLGIPYRTISMQEAEDAEALAAVVHKEDLAQQVKKAQQLDTTLYKTDSLTVLTEALESAVSVNDAEDVTQEDVDNACETLKAAMEQLEEKTPLKVILAIIGGIILAAAGIFAIVWRLTREKRKARKEKKELDFTVTQPAPDFTQGRTVQETSYKELLQTGKPQMDSGRLHSLADRGNMEQTVVLNATPKQEEDAPTSVLQQQTVRLIRIKNQENICIFKFPFTIGKDREKADYCVQGNEAVSRVHATLLKEQDSYFIQDNHATNGTYVNGMRVSAGTKISIRNNDVIYLGNEEFQFKTER